MSSPNRTNPDATNAQRAKLEQQLREGLNSPRFPWTKKDLDQIRKQGRKNLRTGSRE